MQIVAKSFTAFLHDIKLLLKPSQILSSKSDLFLYNTDATSLFSNSPALILIPYTIQELQKIISLINDYKNYIDINFVARGAGTGLSGGCIGSSNSVIISTAQLKSFIAIDEVNQVALIETGLVNSTLSKLIKNSGLYFSPDPSSQDACTIGGNIAENAGGIHCYKYGVTSEQILGLEIVLPNGEIQYSGLINSQACQEWNQSQKLLSPIMSMKARGNIDISRLFVGSEGTYGIVTKALVKLTAIPKSFLTMQIGFSSIAEAGAAVSQIISHGYNPTALELIDSGAIEAVSKTYNLNLEPQVKAVLLLELDGDNDEINFDAQCIKKLILEETSLFQVLQFRETQDLEERKFLWKVRKGTVAAFGQIAPFWYLYDAVVPRSRIAQALSAIEKIAIKHKLKLATVMHAADGNLHPNFLYDPKLDPDVINRIHQASHEIMQLCIDLGGTLSGEHGIGLEKKEYMPFLFSDFELELMFAIRKIFDPKLISNPDKVFPVRICKHC